MKSFDDIKNKLTLKGLKVTPQRITVLEALMELNHPSADHVLEYVHKRHPGVATGTVYSILESFYEKGMVKKVKTDRDIMRYDAITEKHHHLYCAECDRIEDYFDEELNDLLINYFKNKQIPGFTIDDIRLQISGQFTYE